MQLGISSYTYVWWAGVPGYPTPNHPLTPQGLLGVAAALGVSVVQIADNLPLHELSRSELRAFYTSAQELGIEIELGTRGIELENLRRYLAIAVELRSSLLRTLLDSPGHEPSAEEAVADVRRIAPEFEQAGVTLAIENHDRLKSAELRRIIERIGSSFVGVCLDTANSLGCGEGINEVLDSLVDMVCNLHVKDFVVRRLAHNKGFIVEGVPAGQGLLDIPELIDRLRKAGRDVNVILEQWPAPENQICASIEKEQQWARLGIEYLRAVLSENDRWKKEH